MLIQRLRPHVPFALLLLLFAFLCVVYGRVVTPFEGPDEEDHVAYIIWLRQNGRLPHPVEDFNQAGRQQTGQAPLYYVTAAAYSHLLPVDFDRLGQRPTLNPWHAFPTPAHLIDNRNRYTMSPHTHALTPDEVALSRANYWLRTLSPLFGMIALAGIYRAGWLLWPGGRRWALLAVMGMAFTPLLLQGFSVVSNDVAVIAFSAWVLTGALHLVHRWDDPRAALVAGIFMGLAALSKTSGLGLWPLPLLAVALGWWARRGSPWKAARSLGIVLGAALLISGWWYLRGWLLFDDPFGFEPHRRMEWAQTELTSLAGAVEKFRQMPRLLWANFGWGNVVPGNWALVLPGAAVLLGALGGLGRRFDPRALLLLAAVVLGAAAIFQWMRVSAIVPARLFFPFYGALVLLVVWGLLRFPALLPYWAGGLGGLALIVAVVTVYPAFGPPRLLDTPPDNLHGRPLDFSGPRLLGYRIEGEPLTTQTDRLWATLCWQAPDADDPVAIRHAFAIRIMDLDFQRVIGERESYPGLGRYTLWQPGKTFCDHFRLPVDPERIEPGRIYPVLVSLFDYPAGVILPAYTADGQPTNTIVGHLRSAAAETLDAETLSQAAYRFDPVRLVEHAFDSEEMTLRLVWSPVARPGRELSMFAHIFNADGDFAAQVDQPLGGEHYPSWAWNAYERIEMIIELPVNDLHPGQYRIAVGVYDPQTMERLPATDLDGEPLSDNMAFIDTVILDTGEPGED
jgi:hypothetical protein